MDISGSHRIPAPRASVWAGLNDTDVLKECIPGCERLERVSEDAYEGVVAAKVGPLRTAFAGRLTVTASSAPERCEIAAKGEDAAAGSGEGRGEVTLSDEGGETLVTYAGQAEVEGKVAQLGSRLVSGVARQAVETFFARFAALAADGRLPAGGPAESPVAPPLAEAPPLAPDEPSPAPAEVEDVPPLAAAGGPLRAAPPPGPTPIAPTAAPAVPDPIAIAAAEATAPEGGGGGLTRILLVAAVAAVIGAAFYLGLLQPPA